MFEAYQSADKRNLARSAQFYKGKAEFSKNCFLNKEEKQERQKSRL